MRRRKIILPSRICFFPRRIFLYTCKLLPQPFTLFTDCPKIGINFDENVVFRSAVKGVKGWEAFLYV